MPFNKCLNCTTIFKVRNRTAKYCNTTCQPSYKNKRKAPIGLCEICNAISKLNKDHDHKTGYQRGWLCQNCNFGIGFLKDSISNLESAIKYLRRF